MLDIGWMELMVVGIVALIVVGPKDLPKMFRTLGQMTAKARGMAREFQRAMDDAADSTGMKDVARDLRRATDPQGMGLDEINKLRNWDPLKDPKGKAATPPASTTQDDEDEAALDMVAAEMDALRKSRTSKAGSGAPASNPAPDTPELPAAPGVEQASPKGDKGDT
ncbi:MAG: twin-arginine translocase subunit TatB [Rhodobacteraceae bacterium]|nr:MAG: twin-arginine translocase subunit TatB [Paracoccaceae bacterium]